MDIYPCTCDNIIYVEWADEFVCWTCDSKWSPFERALWNLQKRDEGHSQTA